MELGEVAETENKNIQKKTKTHEQIQRQRINIEKGSKITIRLIPKDLMMQKGPAPLNAREVPVKKKRRI